MSGSLATDEKTHIALKNESKPHSSTTMYTPTPNTVQEVAGCKRRFVRLQAQKSPPQRGT